MRHTFVLSGGSRLEIQPSKTEPGGVLLSLLYSSGDLVGCATAPAPTAALIAQALEFEAVAAEDAAQCCATSRPERMGMRALPVVDLAQVGA